MVEKNNGYSHFLPSGAEWFFSSSRANGGRNSMDFARGRGVGWRGAREREKWAEERLGWL
jgi:hypothetical protein